MHSNLCVQQSFFRRGLGVVAVLLLATVPAFAQIEVVRTGWIPSGDYELGAIGDMWSFTCPPKGSVSIFVDTHPDNGAANFPDSTSNIDPVIEVVDGKGALLLTGELDPDRFVTADEEEPCTFTPVCGWSCPKVVDLPCGHGNPHTLAIYSFPSFDDNTNATGVLCAGGGGYELILSAKNKKGKDLKEAALKLGGGAVRKIPRWAGGISKNEPVLNDEGVPSFEWPGQVTFSSFISGFVIEGAVTPSQAGERNQVRGRPRK